MDDLAGLWKAQQQSQFPPSCLPLTIDGLKLVKLDALAGAILTGSFRNDGVPRPLDPSKAETLKQQLRLIERVNAELPLDPAGKAYFARLETLARAVLPST